MGLEDEPDPIVPLEHFLGLQRITHIYAGNDGLLGLDGKLYRFVKTITACPVRYDYSATREVMDKRRIDGHSHYCQISRLAHARELLHEELETIQLVVNLKPIDHTVTFYKHEDLIYAVDESWGTETSGKVIFQAGTQNEIVTHDRFTFFYDPSGFVPSWMPRELDVECTAR